MLFRAWMYLKNLKSLQTVLNGETVSLNHSQNLKSTKERERASHCASGRKRGSLTVEAALVFPVFLLGITAFLYLFFLLKLQTETGRELTDSARERAQAAYFTEVGMDEDSMITLQKSYRVSLPPGITLFHQVSVTQTRTVRGWTGFSGRQQTVGETGEQLVYVTDYGTVYHCQLDCRYLKLSIQRASLEETQSMRNGDGGKYYPCERCWKDGSASVYLTQEGSRYHQSLNCPGLARGIHTVLLSETGGLPPCSACGG